MKISCDIIKDILPLYAEDMVSEATKDMVDEHLCECEGCTKELESLRKPAKVPVEVAKDSLKRVGDSIRRRRILAVMTVFLFIATVLIGGALMLDAKIYLSATEAVEDIYVDGDTVKIVWGAPITGSHAIVDTDDPRNYTVTAWTNLYNYLFPPVRLSYEQLEEDVKALISEEQYASLDSIGTFSLETGLDNTNFIYVDPSDHSMSLILNADQPLPEETMMEVYSYTSYYCWAMVFFGVVFFLIGLMKRDYWYVEFAGRLSMLFLSLALSVVIVTAGQFNGLDGDFREALIDSAAVAVPMTLTCLCARQLIKLNRQDKGL